MADVEILERANQSCLSRDIACVIPTLIPSSEKHGGTAEDSSSASDRRTGNFSTADIGISPL